MTPIAVTYSSKPAFLMLMSFRLAPIGCIISVMSSSVSSKNSSLPTSFSEVHAK